jgi:ribonucleoside-diphosphate reductase alpha chain
MKKNKPDYFVEANDVPIEQHVRMQAAFQKHVHNGVSKTVNCPNSTTIEDVDKIFRLAYKLNCKGVTVYRDGSREFQAQTATKPEPVKGHPILGTVYDDFANWKKGDSAESHAGDAIKYMTTGINPVIPSPDQDTPTWLPGWREKVKTGSGTLWVHVFVDPDTGFREVWTAVSKPGRDMAAAADSTGRLITLALKHGASWDEIVKQLQGHIGEKTVWDNGVQIMSIQDGTAKVIRKRCVDNELPDFVCPFNKKCQEENKSLDISVSEKPIIITDNTQYVNYIKTRQDDLCPDCASILIHDEGCKGGRCNSCGWSNCS